MTRNVKIQVIRGILANMPTLGDGEFYFASDKAQLYVGFGGIPWKIGAPSMAAVEINGNANPTQYIEPNADGSVNVDLVGLSAVLKAVQGAKALPVQNQKDAGRTFLSLLASGVTPAASEAFISGTVNLGGTPTAGNLVYTVPNGFILRLQAIALNFIQSSTTVVACKVNFRLNPSGTVTTSSPLIVPFQLGTGATSAVANTGSSPIVLPFPDGLEIAGGSLPQIGLSAVATSAAGALTIALIGYLY